MVLTRNVKRKPFPAQSFGGHTYLMLGEQRWRKSFFTRVLPCGIKCNEQMHTKHLWSTGHVKQQHPES